MIKFKLNTRDKTGARAGAIKAELGTFNSPERVCVSTEINYVGDLNGITNSIKYPHNFFFAQLRMDAKRFLKRDNNYFCALKRQAMRYLPSVTDKTCILKPVVGVYVYERQKDGTNKKKFRPLNKVDINLKSEQIKQIIRNIVQLSDEVGDYEGMTLPYLSSLFKLNVFNQNLAFAEKYMEDECEDKFNIVPEIPHTDNIKDFEQAFADYYDSHQEGLVSVPYQSKGRYRYTHNCVRDFSKMDKSEKIGIICLDAPRRFVRKTVSYPHYALLEGYDLIVRRMTTTPFLRPEGKGAHKFIINKIKQFYPNKLSVETFNKGLLYDESDVDNSRFPFLKNYTYKELFRLCVKTEAVDTMLKVMESFDSYSEMQKSKPYITSGDFRDYIKQRASLNTSYLSDFSQTKLA